MSSYFVEHPLQILSSRLHKIDVETPNSLFFRWRRDNNARAVLVELFVKPEEVTKAAGDRELGIAESF
jgi:hypothetical protein